MASLSNISKFLYRPCRLPLLVAYPLVSCSSPTLQSARKRQQERFPALVAANQTEAPLEDATPTESLQEPELSQEQLEQQRLDQETKKIVDGIFVTGLNFLITFVVAFMLPSVMPKGVQDSLGNLPGITAFAVVVAAAVTALTAKSADAE